jgi:hypothetical protein
MKIFTEFEFDEFSNSEIPVSADVSSVPLNYKAQLSIKTGLGCVVYLLKSSITLTAERINAKTEPVLTVMSQIFPRSRAFAMRERAAPLKYR